MSTVQLCILVAGATPINGYGVNSSLTGNETGVVYTGYCYPSVVVSGGTGSFTYAWSFTSNPFACGLSSASASTCSVSHSITKFGFDGSAVLQCVINDSAGQSLTIGNVTATFSTDE